MMNEEIKEIIDYLIDEECTRRIKCITIEESKQLLDYITHLQQEKEDYKLRCEKANDYIDNVEISYCRKGFMEDGILISKHVIKNILNGGDNDE